MVVVIFLPCLVNYPCNHLVTYGGNSVDSVWALLDTQGGVQGDLERDVGCLRDVVGVKSYPCNLVKEVKDTQIYPCNS